VWESITGDSAYPRAVVIRCFLVLLASLAFATSGAAAASREPGPSRVALVVLENREYDEVIGNPEAPYLNHLAARGALATNYFGVSHPSLPNYLALLGGSTFEISENCTECVASGPNLATQLSRAGISWRAYMGGMPYPCYTGSSYGAYAKRHDPFMYFPTITSRPDHCANVVPDERLTADLDRQSLPTFSWLSPDLCLDAHDCKLGAADYHLYLLLPRLIHQLGPHGLLIVTFDEGLSESGCCERGHGGWVATILVGPDVPHGKLLRLPSDHYSLLASLEDHYGLPRLREALDAAPLAPALFAAGSQPSPRSARGRLPLDLGLDLREEGRDALDMLAAGAGAELGQLAALLAEGG
jgi:hypothetical protein